MRQECREHFPRHRLQRKPLVCDPARHHGTCVMQVPWYMSGSLTRGGGENVPGIPGACANRNFTYLVRCPWNYNTIVWYTTSFLFNVAIVVVFPYHNMGRERRWPHWMKKSLYIGIEWLCITVTSHERIGDSNHRPLHCLFNSLFRLTPKLCITCLCKGKSPMTSGFTSQKTSNAESDFMPWRHHGICYF